MNVDKTAEKYLNDLLDLTETRWRAERENAERLAKKNQLLITFALGLLVGIIFRLTGSAFELLNDVTGWHFLGFVAVVKISFLVALTSVFDTKPGKIIAILAQFAWLSGGIAWNFAMGDLFNVVLFLTAIGFGAIVASITLLFLSVILLLQPGSEKPGSSSGIVTKRIRTYMQKFGLRTGADGLLVAPALPDAASVKFKLTDDDLANAQDQAKACERKSLYEKVLKFERACDDLQKQNYKRRQNNYLGENAIRKGVYLIPVAALFLLASPSFLPH